MSESTPGADGTKAPLDLEPIKARVQAATEGPWAHETQDGGDFGERTYSTGHVTAAAHRYGGNTKARWDSVTGQDSMTFNDGEFIAHARQDIPALIAEVERLRASPSPEAHTDGTKAPCGS